MKRFKEVIIEWVFFVGWLSIIASSAYGLSCAFGEYSLLPGLFLLFLFPYSIAEKNERKFRGIRDKVNQQLDRPEYDSLNPLSKLEILQIIERNKD